MSSAAAAASRLAQLWRSDLLWDFRHSPLALGAGAVALLCILAALGANWIAPQNPFDLASLNLMDSLLPPAWSSQGSLGHLLGTDDQGRDLFSAILFGARVSLVVGVAAVVLATLLGIAIGLFAGYVGGIADALLMRAADVQLTFPAILTALLVDGIANAALPGLAHGGAQGSAQFAIVVFAIGISRWPQFARLVRGTTLVERDKDYVLAARIIGISSIAIMRRHILPNVLGPVLVVATLNLGLAIIDEATLSFLGVGLPVTQPSLGTLIRNGNGFLFSGEWWITLFPGAALVLMALSINLLGDWLRDALDPRLR